MAKKKKSKLPGKRTTLASKQQKRIKRWRQLHKRLPATSKGWVTASEVFGLLSLFFVNFYLLYPFFGEPDRINNFSAPVIPLLAGLTERAIPFAYGVRLWLLVFLLFFPLAFYLFIKEISGRRLVAFLSTLVALWPRGIFLTSRVSLGFFSQDGAHVASLTLTPLACLLLLRFLKNGCFQTGIFAALLMTLIALTSPIGFMILTTFAIVVTFSEVLLGQGRLKGLRFLVVLFLSSGFAAFWYDPRFALLTLGSTQGQVITKTLFNLIPVSFFLFPVLGVFGFLLFENRPQLQPLFIAFFLSVVFGAFSLGGGVAHSAPSRFLPALGLSLSFLLGLGAVRMSDFLRFSPKVKRYALLFPYRRFLAGFLVLAFLGLSVLMIAFFKQDYWQMEDIRVLGISDEQKVGIWEVKEEIGPGQKVLGYAITGLTTLGVVVLKLRLGI